MNALLRALSDSDRRNIATKLEYVTLESGQVLFEPGRADFAYFLTSGAAAKLVEMANGLKAGAALIGNEGVVPLCCFFSTLEATPYRVETQNAGEGFRMTAEDFAAESLPGRPLHAVMVRYQAVFAAQVLLATACNRLHQIQEQYSRWVLMTHDRMGSDEFTLTQDAIARILGVRRVSITAAARQLRKQGLIDYRRGTLKILDRAGLEKASCECYARANAVYQAILPVAPQVMQTSCRIA